MKKLLALLLAMMLVIPAALADYPDTCSLTFPYEGSPTGSLTLEWYNPPCDAISSSEVFIEGLYVEEKWEEAWRINLLLAEAGDTLSMLRLGDHCMNGLGTPQDEAAAMQWYERAQAHGNRYASRCIALMYLNGWGVEADAQYAAAYAEPGADRPVFSNHELACLYLLGYGNLEPDMEQAMYWFDQYADETIRRRPGGVTESEYQERYGRLLESFRTWDSLPQGLFTRPHPIIWSNGTVTAQDAMHMGDFWRDGDGGVVDLTQAARWYEMAIGMDTNATNLAYQSSHFNLGNFYRDGSLGVIDADRAIRHYGHAATYDRIAELFRDGLTGPDGTVYLAPDAALAEAFAAVDEYRNSTLAHYSLLGDLFRTGISPDGKALVTPDPYLAGLLYFYGDDDPHCAAQLTEMYRAGLITDPMLLYRIARDIPWSECDVSELILLLADDLIHGRVTTWLYGDAAARGYTCVNLGADLLESALEKGKLPDPQAAYDLLALVPSVE